MNKELLEDKGLINYMEKHGEQHPEIAKQGSSPNRKRIKHGIPVSVISLDKQEGVEK